MMNPDLKSHLLDAIKVAQEGDCCRILHGRGRVHGDEFKDLNVDLYDGVVILFSYHEDNANVVAQLADWFESQAGIGISAVVVQHRHLSGAPFEVLWGAVPDELYASEHGLNYRLNLGAHQNFGFFPDMAGMRKWLMSHSKGQRVLNLFAYTCSLSVAAIKGGADKVVNVDMSSPALSVGRDNHRLNELNTSNVVFEKINILKSWGRIAKHGHYDCIISDPPTLQKGSFSLDKDYHKVVRRTADMLVDDGIMFVCANSPSHSVAFLQEMVSAATPNLVFEERMDCGETFCDVDADAGLKILKYRKKVG